MPEWGLPPKRLKQGGAMEFQEQQQRLILEVIQLAARARTVPDLDAILDGPLKSLLRYEMMTCGTGFYTDQGCYVYKYHSRSFPMEFFFELRNPNGSIDSALMRQWLQTRRPVYYQSGRDDAIFPEEWVKVFNTYHLRNTVGHAIADRNDVVGNYFLFARLEGEVGEVHAHVLELVTPSLCLAVNRVLATEENDEDFPGAVRALVSKKQRDILQWIYQGKTNWEISKILDIKEETVKYHVDQAMTKLKVKTRAQAVGRALEIGAISPIKRTVNLGGVKDTAGSDTSSERAD